MTNKRGHGDSGIDERGENVFRLRYRVNRKRFSKTFHGTMSEARKELRRLIRSGDTGEHIAPDKITGGMGQSVDCASGTPARRRRTSTRPCERAHD
jgi:integrase